MCSGIFVHYVRINNCDWCNKNLNDQYLGRTHRKDFQADRELWLKERQSHQPNTGKKQEVKDEREEMTYHTM